MKNKKGFATLEVIVTLVIFLLLIGYGIGHFGIVHTAILHSIAARTYAFETFRHRSNLNYHRDQLNSDMVHNFNVKVRLHSIKSPHHPDNVASATARHLAMGKDPPLKNDKSRDYHNQMITADKIAGKRITDGGPEVAPAWVKVRYGMCLDAWCGGGP